MSFTPQQGGVYLVMIGRGLDCVCTEERSSILPVMYSSPTGEATTWLLNESGSFLPIQCGESETRLQFMTSLMTYQAPFGDIAAVNLGEKQHTRWFSELGREGMSGSGLPPGDRYDEFQTRVPRYTGAVESYSKRYCLLGSGEIERELRRIGNNFPWTLLSPPRVV